MDSTSASTYKGTGALILGICLGVATFWLFALSMSAIIPQIAQTFGVKAGDIALPLSITALASGTLIIPMGSIADKYGRMKITRLGLIIAAIGALIGGLSTNVQILTIGRILQGVAAAMIMPSTLALIKAYYEGPERLKALSYWSMSSWGGGGLAMFFGGVVSTNLGWRYTFFFVIPVAVLALLLTAKTPESKQSAELSSGKKFDVVGLVFLIIGLLALNLAITQGDKFGWTSTKIVGGFILAAFTIGVFILVEKGSSNPLVDLSLFKSRAYNGATISNFLINSTLGSLTILMTYLQLGRGLSTMQSGFLTLGYTAATLIMIRVGEKIGTKFGAYKPMMAGMFLATLGIFMQSITFVDNNIIYFTSLAIGLGIMGIGFGVSATPSTNIAVGESPEDKVGVASAVYKLASSLGGSFGLAIAIVVYGTAYAMTESYDTAGLAGISTGVVAGILSMVIVFFTIPKNK